MKKLIQELKKGDLFRKNINSKKEYEKGPFCRSNKAYECTNLEDISDFIYLKKNKEVVI